MLVVKKGVKLSVFYTIYCNRGTMFESKIDFLRLDVNGSHYWKELWTINVLFVCAGFTTVTLLLPLPTVADCLNEVQDSERHHKFFNCFF